MLFAVDRTRVEAIQSTQTTAGGAEMEIRIESDKEARGQIRSVGLPISSLYGLGEVQVRFISFRLT